MEWQYKYACRWFLITKPRKSKMLLTMALDRIIEFQELPKEKFIEHDGVDFDNYFNDLVGVTKTEKDQARKVVLFVHKYHAPYVLTKPIHHSQQLLREDENGIVIRIDVVLNFELEREILGFGECMKVLAPRTLAAHIRKRLEKAVRSYSDATREAKYPKS